jgi:hypothetical protein
MEGQCGKRAWRARNPNRVGTEVDGGERLSQKLIEYQIHIWHCDIFSLD